MPQLSKIALIDSLFATKDYHELELKILAFKKIYRALRSAQCNSAILKTNFLEGKESLAAHELAQDIKNHYIKKSKSRTARAWELAVKYYNQCHADNADLFNAIYKHAYENTHYLGVTLFNSLAKDKTFTDKDIAERIHINNRIGFMIALELDWSPKNYEIIDPSPAIKVI